jgi:hypothetical protein
MMMFGKVVVTGSLVILGTLVALTWLVWVTTPGRRTCEGPVLDPAGKAGTK